MDVSTEDDTELRDLVVQSLENDGTLGKIRATLRASIFLTLEQQDALNKRHPLLNKKLSDYLDTKEGQIATALVREYLEHFNLLYTLSVFDPETNVKETANREKLSKSLDVEPSNSSPVLSALLRKLLTHGSSKNSIGKNGTLTTPSFSLSVDGSAEVACAAAEKMSHEASISQKSTQDVSTHSTQDVSTHSGKNSTSTNSGQSKKSKKADVDNGKPSGNNNDKNQAANTNELLNSMKNDVEAVTSNEQHIDKTSEHNEADQHPRERLAFEEALNDSFIDNHDDFFDDIGQDIPDIPNFSDLRTPPLDDNTTIPESNISGLHLLGDLPPIGRTVPLVEQQFSTSNKNVELSSKKQDDDKNSLKKIDNKIKDLDFGENLYDEDFSPLSTSISQSSRSEKSHSKSERSAKSSSARLNSKSRSESEASKSAHSHSKKSKNESKSSKARNSLKEATASIEIEEEIGEEIDELDMDDLLNSDIGMDDLTTDKTISRHSGVENADYMEDIAMD